MTAGRLEAARGGEFGAREPGRLAGRVTLVVTRGAGSMDVYARHLARRLPVRTLVLDTFERSGQLFGMPLVSARSAHRLRLDVLAVRELRRLDGLVHLPNHHLSRYGPFLAQPYVVTAHDLIRYFDLARAEPLIHRPNTRDRLSVRLDVVGLRRAAALIVPSRATKRDLVEHLGIPEERITVVYEGVDHELFRPTGRRLHPAPYVLFVGSEHPRKNLAAVFRTLARLKREPRFHDLKLVKVGAPGGPEAPFRQQSLRALAESGLARDDVVFVPHTGDDDLAAYYSGAECFVHPSLLEGFGLPVVEAMACGCPVIVSDAASLPEVAGDGALVVPVGDDAALEGAMRDVLTDPSLRGDLRARAIARAREFSWERGAHETMRVYERVM